MKKTCFYPFGSYENLKDNKIFYDFDTKVKDLLSKPDPIEYNMGTILDGVDERMIRLMKSDLLLPKRLAFTTLVPRRKLTQEAEMLLGYGNIPASKAEYRLARWPNNEILHNEKGFPIYRNKEGVEFNWDDPTNWIGMDPKHEKKFLGLVPVAGQTYDRQGIAFMPPWYNTAYDILVNRMPKQLSKALPEQTVKQLKTSAINLMDGLTQHANQAANIHKILELVVGEQTNMWRYISVVNPNFQNLINSHDKLGRFLWVNFRFWGAGKIDFRRAADQIASMAGLNRWGKLTVFDMLTDAEQRILSQMRDVRLDEDIAKRYGSPKATLNRNFFEKVWVLDALRVVENMLDKHVSMYDKAKALIKVKIFWDFFWNLDHVFRKFLMPGFYSTLMSVWGSFWGLMQLLSLNTMMFVTEAVSRSRYMKIEWSWRNIVRDMKLFWSLSDEHIDLLDFNRRSGGDLVIKTKNRLKNTTSAGWFNAADQLMRDSYYAKRLSYFYQVEFPWIKNTDELYFFLKSLDPEKRANLYERAYAYVEKAVRNESTNTVNVSRTNRLYFAEDPFYQKFKNVTYRLRDFLAGWWRAKVKGFYNELKATKKFLNTDIGKKYLEYLETPSKLADDWFSNLDEFWKTYQLRHIDTLEFFNKITASWLLARTTERVTNDDPYNTRTEAEKLWSALKLVQNFNGSLAAFTILPEVKTLSAVLYNLFVDIDNDWDADFTPSEAVWEGVREAIKTFTRGLWFSRWVIQWVSRWANTPSDLTDKELIQQICEGVMGMATNYMYFYRAEVQKAGYEQNIGISNNAWLRMLTGEWTSQEYMAYDIINNQKLQNAYISKENWFDRMIYSLPYIGDWFKGAIIDDKLFREALENYRFTESYDTLVAWYLPSDTSDEVYEFIYNQVSGNQPTKNKRMDFKTFLVDYSYEDEFWQKKFAGDKQITENTINYLMCQAADGTRLQELTKALYSKDTVTRQRAARALAYLDANAPWSGLVVLSWAMQNRYYDLKNQYFGSDEILTEAEEKALKTQVGKEYWEYAYSADKYSIRPQVMLRYEYDKKWPLSKFLEFDEEANFWSVKLVKSKEEDLRPGGMKNNYILTVFQSMLFHDWVSDAHAVKNLFAGILTPRKEDFNINGTLKKEYVESRLATINLLMDRADKIATHKGEAEVMKMGILMASWQLLEHAIKDPRIDEHIKQSTLNFLWWTATEMKEISDEVKEQIEVGRDWESVYRKGYNPRLGNNREKYMRNADYAIRQLLNMTKQFAPYKNFNYGKNNYGNHWIFYSKKEFDVIKNKNQDWEFYGLSRGHQWQRFDGKKDAPGWSVSQWAWRARPKTAKTEDPDKPVEFWKWGLKRMRKRASVKTDLIKRHFTRIRRTWWVTTVG